MKSIVAIGVIVCLVFGAACGFSADFRLNRIIDGDTLELIAATGERVIVNLVGIDAPEMPKRKSEKGQPFCTQAQKQLSDLLFNKQFSFEAKSRMINHQVLAVVYSDGKNVNLEMIRSGLAEVYKGSLPSDFDIEPYRNEEAAAKKQEKGMWALGKVYMSPSEWRTANTQ